MTHGIDRLRALFGNDDERPKKRARGAALPSRGVCQIVASSWTACHKEFEADCAQCRFRAFGDKWTKTYGTVLHKGSINRRVTWLQERKCEPGSQWGLGCGVCANLRWKLSNRKMDHAACPMRLGGMRCDTKWARLEVCQINQMCAWSFQQHSQTTAHNIALHLYLRPQEPLESVLGNADITAAMSLLQGAVPPPEHWLRVWRFVRTPTSFRGAQAILGTDAFLSHLRIGADRQATSRHAISKTVRCMAEVIRGRTRAALLAAHSVTIAVDDRGPYRLIRYRCDAVMPGAAVVPQEAGRHDVSEACPRRVAARDGIIGVHCTAATKDDTIADLDDDYTERMRDSIVSAIEKIFCIHGEVDSTSAQTVFAKIHTFLGDGAATVQKCGALLRAGRCKNIALILRDPVHAMRTSLSDPLKRHGDFKSFWDDVFDGRHALVPDVQNSDVWRRRLVLAQQHVLKVSGVQGGGLACALRHLSFAKQRFDSATGPARKFCCLLAAIVVLLVTVAADRRLKTDQRDRAQKLIDDMTPARIVTAGLFADYMAECSVFFRQYEKTHHDVALSYSQKHAFVKRMKVLFRDGYVFAELPAATVEGVACPADETCTAIAVSQAMAFGTLQYEDRSITLWPTGARAAADAARAQMVDIVEAALDRVEAEMPDTDLVCSFAVFDLETWQRIRKSRRNPQKRDKVAEVMRIQHARARRLARALPSVTDVDATADSLCAVAEVLSAACPGIEPRNDLAAMPHVDMSCSAKVDNPYLWGLALARGDCLGDLRHLVYWYLSMLDNTGVVERDLGALLRSHVQHLGLGADVLQDVLLVFLDGPLAEEEIVTSAVLDEHHESSAACPAGNIKDFDALLTHADRVLQRAYATPGQEYNLRMTPFTEECTREWVQRHGRRFSRSSKLQSSRPVPTSRKKGTDAAVRAAQKRALEQRVSAAASPRASSLRTLFGRPLAWRPASGEKTPSSKTFNAFKALTITKKSAQMDRERRRRWGQEPYTATKPRRGGLFSDAPKPNTATACPRPQRPRRVRSLNLTASMLEDKGAGYRMITPPMTARDLENVDLIILSDLSIADSMPHDGDLLVAMLAAVAFGITLVAKQTWQREDDPFVSEACVRHVPSLEKVAMTVLLTAPFTQKHARCAKVLQAASARPRSKWQVKIAADAAEDAKAWRVDCLSDVAPFIRRARRILRPGGKVQGTFFPASAAMSLISEGTAGAPSVRTSSGHAQLARVATGHTRGAALRALFATSV